MKMAILWNIFLSLIKKFKPYEYFVWFYLRPVFVVHALKWSLSSLARLQGCSLSSSTPSLSFQKVWMTSTWMRQSTLCSSLSTFSQQVSLTQAPILYCLSSGESYQAFICPYPCLEISVHSIFRGEEIKK